MTWRYEDVVTFVRVMELGSVTVAADRMKLSKSVVSRRIADLEKSLTTDLFRRTTRHMVPTEDGQAFYDRIAPLMRSLNETAEDFSAKRAGALRGAFRMTVPVSLGTMYLGPIIASFVRQHPDLELAIDYDDRLVDLTRLGYDLGIRVANLADSGLKARKLGECERIVCCSPDYARDHGLPAHVSDLAAHRFIDYAHVHASRFWRFESEPKSGAPLSIRTNCRIIANNGDAIRDMAVAGLGIASLPVFLIADELRNGSLIRAVPEAVQKPYVIAAVYPAARHGSAKVRAFVDHLRSAFAAPFPWDDV